MEHEKRGAQWELRDSVDDREALIKRIVEEKGVDAFDALVKLLDDDEEEVREIASETLHRLGEAVAGKLEKTVRERVRKGERNSTSLLYLIDLVGDLGVKSLAPELREALRLYDLEEFQLVIYEALAKIGACEEFYPLLRYMLLEGEERYFLGSQVAMVLSYLDLPEVVADLVLAIDGGDFKGDDLEILKKALSNVVARHPAYKEILLTLVGEENFERYVT